MLPTRAERASPVEPSRLAPAAFLLAFMATCAPTVFGQAPTLRVEHRTAVPVGADVTEVNAATSVGATLIFRITNLASGTRTVLTRIDLPVGWQVLFASDHLELTAGTPFIDSVTVAPPRDAAAGDYTVRYEARLTSSDAAVTASATVRIAQRRQVALSWMDAPAYLPAGESATFDLRVANRGNVAETVTVDVRSRLGVPLQTSWTGGAIEAGDVRQVRVTRLRGRAQQGDRETLTAAVRADQMTAVTEASIGFDVVPEGHALGPPRGRLPASVAIRTGPGRLPGFGSFVGSGAVDQHRSTTVSFGFLAKEQSLPLTLEENRNYFDAKGIGWNLALGDQSWSLSPLTESGHYGLGAGGRVERPHWSAGAFVDVGRDTATEGRQVGGSFGLSTGRVANLSMQYLRMTGQSPSAQASEIGSLRLVLKPTESLTGEFEAGTGRSAGGTGKASSAQISFNSSKITLFGRRVRRDDAYPIRDRASLLNGAGISVRPFGRLKFEGTFDGTERIDDPTLPKDAPTRQRNTRATASWGPLARVSAGRTEWTSPDMDWTGQWRRDAATAELRVPLGPVWLSPGAEQGTETTPTAVATPYSLNWLRAGVKLSRNNSVTARAEFGRGSAGDASRRVRRLSFEAVLRPAPDTNLSVQVQNSATDALWLQGTRWVRATLDQRLPWNHHVVANYQSRSGGRMGAAEAYRVDYVVPIGIPLRSTSAGGRISVRLRDGDTGRPHAAMLVQIDRQFRLTDRDGLAIFTGLKPGDHNVMVASGSVGPGNTVVPALPLRVSVKDGGRLEVSASIVRTARVKGRVQLFQTASGGLSSRDRQAALVPAAGIAGALVDLVVNDEHRTAVSDAQGRFAFEGVPPGHWPLRVVRVAVPAFFRLEAAETTVALAPGETREVVLRVVPKSSGDADGFEQALLVPDTEANLAAAVTAPPDTVATGEDLEERAELRTRLAEAVDSDGALPRIPRGTVPIPSIPAPPMIEEIAAVSATAHVRLAIPPDAEPADVEALSGVTMPSLDSGFARTVDEEAGAGTVTNGLTRPPPVSVPAMTTADLRLKTAPNGTQDQANALVARTYAAPIPARATTDAPFAPTAWVLRVLGDLRPGPRRPVDAADDS